MPDRKKAARMNVFHQTFQNRVEYACFTNDMGMYHNARIWHMHNTIELGLYTSNTILAKNGTAVAELDAPCLLVHRPFTLHHVQPVRPEVYTRHILNFDMDYLTEKERALLSPDEVFPDDFAAIPLSEEKLARLIPLFCAFGDPANDAISHYLLLTLLAELQSCVPAVHPSHDTTRTAYIHDAVRYLRLHYAEPITSPDLARLYNVSVTKLNKDFRTFTRSSVHEMLVRFRLYAATRLLLTEPSVSAIALACGFNSESHFIRAFGSSFHISPLQYAKIVRK